MKTTITIALSLSLTACAVPTVWYKSGATQDSFKQDLAQCEYEAASNTSITSGRRGAGAGAAFAAGFAEGLAEGSRRQELKDLCLRARGYTAGR